MGNLILIIQLLIIHSSTVFSSIAGLSYIDPLDFRPLPQDNPCNPLYWYPREIPAYCYQKPSPPPLPIKTVTPPPPPPPPQNILIPRPLPAPVPIPIPLPISGFVPLIPPPPPQPIYRPPPFYPGLTVPPGFPNVYPGVGYPGFMGQSPGFLPGLPGLVTREGGINVMPFSDAYSKLLNNHMDDLMIRRYRKYMRERPWLRRGH